ncbi:sugar transferase [Calothrix sp. 336/3]|uniref:sugar transferase n=1 Tax=Calothrix sp. 336/3 TaxID=1337936 RepID=UPI0004E31CD9|nr:sugar transferase [Calothrix sp. 336/3]AKG20043.1 galactosyl-1-phosphate transferase [Calothrix sp. 336/3]
MTAQSSLLSGKRSRSASRRRRHLETSTSVSEVRVQPTESGIPDLEGSRTLFTGKQRSPKTKPRGSSFEGINGEFAKRLFDIVFSLVVLVLFSPVYLVLAFLIALSSEGPIFYVQERVGKNYKPFNCIKFRTMVSNADEVLSQMMETSPHLRREFELTFKLKQDPRITRIGKFLRITSLDEFPQFWNVLKGDMSVVGPRPLVAEELPKYGYHIDQILTIRPGITGLWQVSGRNDIPYPRRVQIDLHYAKFRNFWLDLWIVFKTIRVVIVPKDNGAY